MDKKIILAVAGSGKTTYIVDSLSLEKRSLIITYTIANYENLRKKILERFDGVWPDNITLMTFFSFLFKFCYKPFLSDKIHAQGIAFNKKPNRYAKKYSYEYYFTKSKHFYSNRLSLYLVDAQLVSDISKRVECFFDEFVIDEVQDVAGGDFSLLEKLMEIKVNQLFVGDYYQHTYDTSRDGNLNKSLFEDRGKYEDRFKKKGFEIDKTTLLKSYRCSQTVCSFISEYLGIDIESNRLSEEDTLIEYIDDLEELEAIMKNDSIVKLHYQKAYSFGDGHRNWGDTKGEDSYNDVCVLLNKTTKKAFEENKLAELSPRTKNKLYVAISRARGNVYFADEKKL